jgi:hypothetical protein
MLTILVVGGLVLCGTGAAALIVLLLLDSKNKRIW